MSDSPDLTRDGHPRRRAPRRRRAITPTPEMLAGCPPFTPVPRLHDRHDGWTPERQQAFLVALGHSGCVRLACQRVGMTEVGAYLLRRQPGGEDFARAWAEVQATAVDRLEDAAFERALHGVPVPIFHAGEQVGEKRWYNDRLLMWTLRHHAPDRYGVAGSAGVTPQTRRALYRQWEEERVAKEGEAVATAAAERRLDLEAYAAPYLRNLSWTPANAAEREAMLNPRIILIARLVQMHHRLCEDPACDWRGADGNHRRFSPLDYPPDPDGESIDDWTPPPRPKGDRR